MTPWLSVIVPTYNGQQYLAQTLDSVLAQPADLVAGLDLIAVDDGSTDATVAVLERYRERLPLRIEQRQVANWVANTNYGLGLATARHACFLHQDDLWLPGRLQAVRAMLDTYPDAALHVHDSAFIDEQGRRLGRWSLPLHPLPVRNQPTDTVGRLLVQNSVAIPAPTFERELVLRSGGLDESLWYTADWDLWLRLAGTGPTVRDPNVYAAFRIHAASLTVTGSRRLDAFEAQLRVVLDRHAGQWVEPAGRRRRHVLRWAEASLQTNNVLAAMAAGERPPLGRWLSAIGRTGPFGVGPLLYRSRLAERVAARLRAGLHRRAG